MRLHVSILSAYFGHPDDDIFAPGLCSFSSSRSRSSQSTQVTDQRAGASGGSIAATSGASVNTSVSIFEENLSDEALRELVGLGKLTITEGIALAGQGLDFADDQSKRAVQIQSESLRLVDEVLTRDQEPGTEATRAALIAVVAVIGLVFAVPAIFKRA